MKAVQVFLAILFVALAAADFQPIEPYKTYPSSCKAAKAKKDGIYKIQLKGGEPFEVYCDAKTAGVGWLVIQRRVDANINFFRNWSSYQQGFGPLTNSFFIGLNRLHNLTAAEPQELYVHLEDFTGQKRFAKYSDFAIGNEANLYSLYKLGNFAGSAGDAFSYQRGMNFSTYDRDNDRSIHNCAAQFSGAWWYNSCMYSNLNGQYLGGEYGRDLEGRGMAWVQWLGINYSYKTVQMMIRPKN